MRRQLIAALCLGFLIASASGQNKEEIPTLVKQLKDKDETVRLKAAKTLGKLGVAAKESLPALTDALKDKDEDVRSVAKKSIASIKAAIAGSKQREIEEALQPFLKDLKSKAPAVRIKALESIGELGTDAKIAGQDVTMALFDKVPEVRKAGTDALEKIDPAVQKHIVTLMVEQEVSVRIDAVESIGKLGSDGKTALPVLVFIYQQGLADGSLLRRYGQGALTSMIQVAPDDKRVIQIILGTIAAKRGTNNREGMDSGVRSTAIELLGKVEIDPKVSTKALLAAFDDPYCCVQAIKAIEKLGKDAEDALPTLKRLKSMSPVIEIREAAAKAIEAIQ